MTGEKKRFRLSHRLVWLAALLLLLVLIQVLFDPFSMLVTFILSRGIRLELPRESVATFNLWLVADRQGHGIGVA